MKRILCTLCVSLLGWQALAGNVDDSLKKLESAVAAKETAKNPGDPNIPSPQNLRDMMLSRLRECIASNNMNGAIETLQQFSISPMLSEDTQKASAELLAALRTDQEARDKAFAAQTDAALKHAAAAVKKAKTAADLDPVLEELAAAQVPQQKRDASSEKLRAFYSKLEDVSHFVARFQEYLAAKAGGYEDDARKLARDLANSPAGLLPRSELLAKAYEPKTAGPTPMATESEQVTLNLDLDGRVRIGRAAPVTLEALKDAVERIHAGNPNVAVILRTADHQPYQKIMDVMDILKQAGIWNVTFASTLPLPAK